MSPSVHPIADRYQLTGRVAAVTGGGDGIGRATCELLGRSGVGVAVLDRDADKARQVAAAIGAEGGRALAIAVDVVDEAQVKGAFERIAAEFGGLDILVNNAGLAVRGPAADLAIEDWNRVLAVNLTGMFLVARSAARLMEGRPGAIVNTASIMGLSGGIYPNIAYQTTKGGVVNMTRALALEWVGRGIRVNAVAPTYVRTGFIAPLLNNPEALATILAATPMGRLAEPEEVADAIVFLASSAAAMITGVTLPVDGGFLAR